jgi:hypothetical protein
LIGMGVERELERAGAKPGDDVVIGEVSFTFEPENNGNAQSEERGDAQRR